MDVKREIDSRSMYSLVYKIFCQIQCPLSSVFRKIFNKGYVIAGFDRRNSAYIAVTEEHLPGKIREPIFPVR